jgi:hypothetical protein
VRQSCLNFAERLPRIVIALVVFLLFCLVASGVRFLATFIKTYGGRRVVIPNAGLFSDSVIVNTAHDLCAGWSGRFEGVGPVAGRGLPLKETGNRSPGVRRGNCGAAVRWCVFLFAALVMHPAAA